MIDYKDVVIVAYGRSPMSKAFKGGMSGMHPIEYGAQVLNGVVERVPGLKKEEIEDVIVGCAMQFGETSMNVARMIVNRAGFPDKVCGMTINRFCSAGLQAVSLAVNAIQCGQGDVYIAGGVESMTATINAYPEYKGSKNDGWLEKNYPGAYMAMGITAENVAEEYSITRRQMDEFAQDSHKKAARAQSEGKLDPSIIPVTVTDKYGEPVLDEKGDPIILTKDEGIRPDTNADKLAELKPCFKEDGLVTAATSSQMDDCAAFVVLMSSEKAKELGLSPIGYMKSFAVEGLDATKMGLGPIYAVPKALKRADLTADDMDIIEINEAFAAQAIPCCRELGFDMDKVNPYGGAISLGHPLGATGAVLIGKMFDYLKDTNGKYGLVTMCIGGGMGAAAVFERYIGQ